MAAVRTARSVWTGSVTEGGGKVTAVTSGTFTDLDVTLPTRRDEEAQGNTSPEELIAAAHASCYSMALSAGLTRAGTPPDSLDVSASVTFDMVDGAPTVTTSVLSVSGSVPGVTADEFAAAAETAKAGCPISRALAGVEISLESVSLA
jgi:osmotically inducible protein OsmC